MSAAATADVRLGGNDRKDSGMELPVWVTVLIGRTVGGAVTGLVAGVVVASTLLSHPTGFGLSHSSGLAYAMGIAFAAAIVTGLVTARLMPLLSGCRVDVGTAMLAAFAGEMVPFIGATIFTHAAFASRGDTSWSVFAGASPIVSLAFTAIGVLVTVWMITSSTQGGTSRGPNLDLYSRARQTSLDEPPSER
jgi:hypothetical protein